MWNWTLIFSLILLSAFFSPLSCSIANDWKLSEEFEAWGCTFHVYFEPEPGSIASSRSLIKGIIDVKGQCKGFGLEVGLTLVGTWDGEEIIEQRMGYEIDGSETFLTGSNSSWYKEIPINVPEVDTFECYMMVSIVWWDYDLKSEDRVIKVRAEYRKTPPKGNAGFPLSEDAIHFIVSSLVLLILGVVCVGVVCAGVVFIIGLNKYGLTIITIKQIQQFLHPFLTQRDETKLLDTINQELLQPGIITHLNDRKNILQVRLAKEKPTSSQEGVITRFNELRTNIEKNSLYSIISSHFLRASRKKESYPSDKLSETRIQLLRDSLRKGQWNGLDDPQNVKLAADTCLAYLHTHKAKNDIIQLQELNIPEESKTLAEKIKKYLDLKQKHQYSYNGVIRQHEASEELQEKIEEVDSVLKRIQSLIQDNPEGYKRKCDNEKKQITKYLDWLDATSQDFHYITILREYDALLNRELEYLE